MTSVIRAKYDDETRDRLVEELEILFDGVIDPAGMDLLREVIDKVKTRRCSVKRRHPDDDGGALVSIVRLRKPIPEDW